ncbi:hypothetical protein LXL04_008620 [Taraxacum kok-saghyz]
MRLPRRHTAPTIIVYSNAFTTTEATISLTWSETITKGLFARRSDQRPRLGPRTRSVVCAFDSGRRTRTPDSVRRFASDSVRPKKSQTEFLPVISDSVRGLMSVRASNSSKFEGINHGESKEVEIAQVRSKGGRASSIDGVELK